MVNGFVVITGRVIGFVLGVVSGAVIGATKPTSSILGVVIEESGMVGTFGVVVGGEMIEVV